MIAGLFFWGDTMGISWLGEGDYSWPKDLEKKLYLKKLGGKGLDEILDLLENTKKLQASDKGFPWPRKGAKDGYIRVFITQAMAWAGGPQRIKIQKAIDEISKKCKARLADRKTPLDKDAKATLTQLQNAAMRYSLSIQKKELEKQAEQAFRKMTEGALAETKKSFGSIYDGYNKLAGSHPNFEKANDSLDMRQWNAAIKSYNRTIEDIDAPQSDAAPMSSKDKKRKIEDATALMNESHRRIAQEVASGLSAACADMAKNATVVLKTGKRVAPPGLNDMEVARLRKLLVAATAMSNTRPANMFPAKFTHEMVIKKMDYVHDLVKTYDRLGKLMKVPKSIKK